MAEWLARARAFWGRRGKIGKAAIIILAVLVVLIFIGALVPTESDETASTTTTETVVNETESQQTETEETQETEPPDTGRMTETEYETFARYANDFDGELSQYGQVIGKCGVLAQSLELAAASECVEDAWGGVWDSGQDAYLFADDYLDDTAKGCRKALATYKVRLDLFATALKRASEAGMNLNFEESLPLSRRANRLAKPYAKARNKVHLACVPL